MTKKRRVSQLLERYIVSWDRDSSRIQRYIGFSTVMCLPNERQGKSVAITYTSIPFTANCLQTVPICRFMFIHRGKFLTIYGIISL